MTRNRSFLNLGYDKTYIIPQLFYFVYFVYYICNSCAVGKCLRYRIYYYYHSLAKIHYNEFVSTLPKEIFHRISSPRCKQKHKLCFLHCSNVAKE